MKRLLFGGFIVLSFLRLSYAEPLCKDDLDCMVKYVSTNDTSYLEYGCNNYKNQSYGHSCIKLYGILLNKIKKDVVYLCNKGTTAACEYKILYNFDGKFRDKMTVAKETLENLKQSEQRCEDKMDVLECIDAYSLHQLMGNSEKAKYYLNKIADY